MISLPFRIHQPNRRAGTHSGSHIIDSLSALHIYPMQQQYNGGLLMRITRPSRRLFKFGPQALLLAVATLLLAGLHTSAAMAQACEPLGPEPDGGFVDVNDPVGAATVSLVEYHHFTPEVENLTRGRTGTVPADIDFVLRKIPNHYRALSAMGRWQLANKAAPGDAGSRIQPAECYFRRAEEFRPKDARIRIAYAVYLHRSGKLSQAESKYSEAEALGADNAEYYANRGLLMIDVGNLTKAQEYSDKAYAMGYPLPGLRRKLAAKLNAVKGP